MSASEQASEPSSSSSPPPLLPPPLPPPPPSPPVAAEGRGAQAAQADAVWARIREAPPSSGHGGGGPPHLHAISMRPPPAPPRAGFICMHIPRRHIPGLNPAAPACGCVSPDARLEPEAGEGSPGTRWEGRERKEFSVRTFPGTPNVALWPNPWFLEFRDGKDRQREVSSNFSTSFRLLGKPQDFLEERGGENCPRKKSQQTTRTQRLPHAAAPALRNPGDRVAVEKCEKPRNPWKGVRSLSGAASPPPPPGLCRAPGPR